MAGLVWVLLPPGQLCGSQTDAAYWQAPVPEQLVAAQGPLVTQEPAQQKPPTQRSEMQEPLLVQAPPAAIWPAQVPVGPGLVQVAPGEQSALLLQLALQAVPPSQAKPPGQAPGLPGVHSPPAHEPAGVSVAPVQLAEAPHDTLASG
jgi:hypothetical protein